MKKLLTIIILSLLFINCAGQSPIIATRAYVDNLSSFTDSEGQIQVDSLLKLMQLPTVDSLYYILMAKKSDSTISVILYNDFVDSLGISTDTTLWRLSDGDIFTKYIDTVYIKILRSDTITAYVSSVNPVVVDDNLEVIQEATFDSTIYYNEPDTNNSPTYLASWNPSDSSLQVSNIDSLLPETIWKRTNMLVELMNDGDSTQLSGELIAEQEITTLDGLRLSATSGSPLGIGYDYYEPSSLYVLQARPSGSANLKARFVNTEASYTTEFKFDGNYGDINIGTKGSSAGAFLGYDFAGLTRSAYGAIYATNNIGIIAQGSGKWLLLGSGSSARMAIGPEEDDMYIDTLWTTTEGNGKNFILWDESYGQLSRSGTNIDLGTVAGGSKIAITGYIDATMTTYGTTSVGDSSVTIDLTQDTWTNITNSTNNLLTLQSPSQNLTVTNDTIFPTYSGIYQVNWHVSFEGTNNETFKFRALVTDTEDFVACSQVKVSSTDRETVSGTATLEISGTLPMDGFVIQVYNATDNDDITINCITIDVKSIQITE